MNLLCMASFRFSIQPYHFEIDGVWDSNPASGDRRSLCENFDENGRA